jgi:hypothetical protein
LQKLCFFENIRLTPRFVGYFIIVASVAADVGALSVYLQVGNAVIQL